MHLYPKAIEFYQACLKLVQKHGDKGLSSMSATLNGLGNANQFRKRYNKAI